MEDCNTRCRDG